MFGRNKPRIQEIQTTGAEWALVVGDIHGHLSALEALYRLFLNHTPPTAARRIIAVGDLVDRGPDSCGVIDWFLSAPMGEQRLSVRGNHEMMFLDFLDQPTERHPWFRSAGGLETLQSYETHTKANWATADLKRIAARVPPDHRAFLTGLPDVLIVDEVGIVHAAIDPLRPLSQQSRDRLHLGPCLAPELARLLDLSAFPFNTLVHGHQQHAKPIDPKTGLINLDTGCYRTGTLTGLILRPDGEAEVISVQS